VHPQQLGGVADGLGWWKSRVRLTRPGPARRTIEVLIARSVGKALSVHPMAAERRIVVEPQQRRDSYGNDPRSRPG
jgi:hypothetical protein